MKGLGPRRRGWYSDFCLLQRLGLFLGVQNLEFLLFCGLELYGCVNLGKSRFGGMSISTVICLGCQLIFILNIIYLNGSNCLVYA